jgi:hypothetical protein
MRERTPAYLSSASQLQLLTPGSSADSRGVKSHIWLMASSKARFALSDPSIDPAALAPNVHGPSWKDTDEIYDIRIGTLAFADMTEPLHADVAMFLFLESVTAFKRGGALSDIQMNMNSNSC